jgi:hypothetical protein
MEKGDSAQKKMNPEKNHEYTYDEGSRTISGVGICSNHRRRILRLSRFDISDRFRRPAWDDDHAYDVCDKSCSTREEKKNGDETYQYGIHIEILGNPSTNTRDYFVFLTLIKSFHFSSSALSLPALFI